MATNPRDVRYWPKADIPSCGVSRTGAATSTLESVISALMMRAHRGAAALNVLSSPMLHLNRRVIIERAAELRLPAIYQWPETADEGGLLGYGPSFIEVFRQRARMAARVLRGAKPADLPIEQPSTFKLTINLKTAKAMSHLRFHPGPHRSLEVEQAGGRTDKNGQFVLAIGDSQYTPVELLAQARWLRKMETLRGPSASTAF
jgi:ABC transporter substrate binding protein